MISRGSSIRVGLLPQTNNISNHYIGLDTKREILTCGWLRRLWVLVLLFLPETKALTLEELDQVFSVPTWKHSSYQLKKVVWCIRKYILRQDLEPMPPFWQGMSLLTSSLACCAPMSTTFPAFSTHNGSTEYLLGRY